MNKFNFKEIGIEFINEKEYKIINIKQTIKYLNEFLFNLIISDDINNNHKLIDGFYSIFKLINRYYDIKTIKQLIIDDYNEIIKYNKEIKRISIIKISFYTNYLINSIINN